jgi:hypothetical protein
VSDDYHAIFLGRSNHSYGIAIDAVDHRRPPAQHWDDFDVFLTSDNRLRIQGHKGFVEPICPRCNEPIAWVLDMMSFARDDMGGFTAHHARCVWSKDGFTKQRKLADP